LTDFRQTFVTGASRDRDELIRFWDQKVKVQGHTIVAEAHSSRRYRRVQLFLVFNSDHSRAGISFGNLTLLLVNNVCMNQKLMHITCITVLHYL